MIKSRTSTLLITFFALCIFALQAQSAIPLQLKTLRGIWTCPTCEALGQVEKYETCEALGHKHALKLDNGTYVTFADNARAGSLIKGGGRHDTRITVVGFYDSTARTIDVEAYRIDGVWSSWCDKHERMDLCRSGSVPSPSEAENNTEK